MASIFYVEISESNQQLKHTFPSATVCRKSTSRQDSTGDIVQRHCLIQTLATCWELLFATFCALLCSSYAIHHDESVCIHYSSKRDHSTHNEQGIISASSDSQTILINTSYFAFILNPSPILMLFGCLILGCSISSFAYRRQRYDRYQSLIFVLAITISTIFGLSLGINANLIMLGLIPWALCSAMVCSVAVHWAIRRCTRGTNARIQCCEIGVKEKLPLPSEKQ
ncbi:hypothetical protein BKA65DRAFT_491839 [Rhexocercosporidium sp. MPI-PUGE-AT-0058]|nr:hypothetical protein BKA65DRAFT_491839 [Rhexocercosporidium sp. MPI-PUGE-AT-0058]